jgi:hypothetical protein
MAMSDFAQIFADAQDALYTYFGVPATYNGADITVCVRGFDTQVEQYPEVWVAAATIDVRAADVPAPAIGDEVVMDGVTYQVGDIVSRDELAATLALTKQMVRV